MDYKFQYRASLWYFWWQQLPLCGWIADGIWKFEEMLIKKNGEVVGGINWTKNEWNYFWFGVYPSKW